MTDQIVLLIKFFAHSDFRRLVRDHPYITSAKGLGGVRKLAIFADVQYYLVGWWVRKRSKMC
jgi:hypothetical protein